MSLRDDVSKESTSSGCLLTKYYDLLYTQNHYKLFSSRFKIYYFHFNASCHSFYIYYTFIGYFRFRLSFILICTNIYHGSIMYYTRNITCCLHNRTVKTTKKLKNQCRRVNTLAWL